MPARQEERAGVYISHLVFGPVSYLLLVLVCMHWRTDLVYSRDCSGLRPDIHTPQGKALPHSIKTLLALVLVVIAASGMLSLAIYLSAEIIVTYFGKGSFDASADILRILCWTLIPNSLLNLVLINTLFLMKREVLRQPAFLPLPCDFVSDFETRLFEQRTTWGCIDSNSNRHAACIDHANLGDIFQ